MERMVQVNEDEGRKKQLQEENGVRESNGCGRKK